MSYVILRHFYFLYNYIRVSINRSNQKEIVCLKCQFSHLILYAVRLFVLRMLKIFSVRIYSI